MLRLVADASSSAQPASATSDEEAAEPPESPSLDVKDDVAADSRARVANDAVGEPSEHDNEEAPNDEVEDSENPASAPRAKVVGPVEPVSPRPMSLPPPADPTEMPVDEVALLPDPPAAPVPAKPL
ncbi:MAG TPA: hypothetical protein PKA58_25890, partial [Polyangium sp.]|nr:hypothetical protein [Polyangium sp.]